MKSLLLIFIPFFVFAEQPDAIYGTNDLVNLSQVKDQRVKELAKAVAVRVERKNLKLKKGKYHLKLKSFKEVSEGKLCENIPYYNKPRIEKSCTGFLVGEKELLTTLHCLESDDGKMNEDILEVGCKQFSWAFDYLPENIKKKNFEIKKENLYSCKNILEFKGKIGNPDYFEDDYILIELDRVVSRAQLKISKNFKEIKNVIMIGHPMGLPMMVSSKGEVLESLGQFLFTNLEAFEGSSGSPVFEKESLQLVGILNSGNTDYFDNGRCVELKTYSENEGIEAFYFLRYYKQTELVY